MASRKVMLVVCAGVILGIAGGWWLASATVSPEQRASSARPPEALPVTAPVVSGELVEEMTARGEIRRESSVVIALGSPGVTAVVTDMSAEVGDVLRAGDVVGEVNGAPVIVLPGSFPLYRELRAGDEGPDVGLVQEGLRMAGSKIPRGENGVFGPETRRALGARIGTGGEGPESLGAHSVAVVPQLPAEVVSAPQVGAAVDGESATIGLSYGEYVAVAEVAPAVAMGLTSSMAASAEVDGQDVDAKILSIDGDPTSSDPYEVVLSLGAGIDQVAGQRVLIRIVTRDVAADALLVAARAVAGGGAGPATVLVKRDDSFEAVPVRVLGEVAGRAAVEALTPGSLAAGDLVRVDQESDGA